jgi:hypothetical protein
MTSAEPEIVSYGRSRVSLYSTAELEASLHRAFVDGRADFIVLDNNMRGQGFVSASAAHGIDMGWLYCSQRAGDEQSQVFAFRLTEAGRKRFGRDE